MWIVTVWPSYNINIAYVSISPTPTYPTLGLIILIGVNIITSSCVTFLQYEWIFLGSVTMWPSYQPHTYTYISPLSNYSNRSKYYARQCMYTPVYVCVYMYYPIHVYTCIHLCIYNTNLTLLTTCHTDISLVSIYQ